MIDWLIGCCCLTWSYRYSVILMLWTSICIYKFGRGLGVGGGNVVISIWLKSYLSLVSLYWYVAAWTIWWSLWRAYAGADPGFQVRGGALKKIAPSRGRCEHFWGISCEKSRFYAKKSYFFQLRREARKILGYFVWKITILRQKILIFSNFPYSPLIWVTLTS